MKKEGVNKKLMPSIDTSMIVSKLATFLANAKDGCYWPYMMPFLISVGLSTSEAGLVAGVRLLGSIVGAPVWGMVADHSNKHYIVLLILCVCSCVVFCSQPIGTLVGCPSTTSREIINATNPSEVEDEFSCDYDHALRFVLLISINTLAAFFDSSLLSFVDSAVLETVAQRGASYGNQRVFGSVGFACGMLMSGVAITFVPAINGSSYTVIFGVYFFLVTCLAVVGKLLYGKLQPRDTAVKTEYTEKKRKVLWKTLIKFDNVFFFMTVYVLGLLQAFFASFMTLYFERLAENGGDFYAAVNTAVGSVSSVLFLAMSTRLIGLFGCWNLLAVGSLTWFLKYLFGYFIRTAWHFFVVELLMQGPGQGLVIACVMHHLKRISPSCILTTSCSITNSLFYYVSSFFASVVGGLLIEMLGLYTLFLAFSALGIVWSLLIVLFVTLYKPKFYEEQKTELLQAFV